MKILAALRLLVPSLACADCSDVGAVLVDCDGSAGITVMRRRLTQSPIAGLRSSFARAGIASPRGRRGDQGRRAT